MILKKTDKKTEESQEAGTWFSERLLGKAGFLLNKAAQKVRDAYEAQLSPLGLTGKHYGVLAVLEEKGSVTQHEIGKCVYIDRTTMVSVIDDLEKLGLVERKEHPTDRRSHAIYMTVKGKETLPKAHQLGVSVEKRFLECFSAKEQKELIKLLRMLVVTHYAVTKEKV
ncbi:MAG TPA: MarR family transcriptional regulator [bacterium]